MSPTLSPPFTAQLITRGTDYETITKAARDLSNGAKATTHKTEKGVAVLTAVPFPNSLGLVVCPNDASTFVVKLSGLTGRGRINPHFGEPPYLITIRRSEGTTSDPTVVSIELKPITRELGAEWDKVRAEQMPLPSPEPWPTGHPISGSKVRLYRPPQAIFTDQELFTLPDGYGLTAEEMKAVLKRLDSNAIDPWGPLERFTVTVKAGGLPAITAELLKPQVATGRKEGKDSEEDDSSDDLSGLDLSAFTPPAGEEDDGFDLDDLLGPERPPKGNSGS